MHLYRKQKYFHIGDRPGIEEELRDLDFLGNLIGVNIEISNISLSQRHIVDKYRSDTSVRKKLIKAQLKRMFDLGRVQKKRIKRIIHDETITETQYVAKISLLMRQ